MQTSSAAPVVVGVTGTAASLAAVRLAAREAVARQRELRVVHVFTWPAPHHGAEATAYGPARREAAAIVDRAVTSASHGAPGVRVTGQVLDGAPARVLLQLSRSAELLVVGDEGLAGAPRVPVDSVLLQTASRAFCPTVVARGPRPPAGPLLVGVDGSASSVRALRYAAAEARHRGTGVEVVHVMREPAHEAEGTRLLAGAVAAVPELVRPRTRLLTGDPAATLARASRSARMVVVAPRGRDRSALLGPVAQELLRRCACPTLFVHGTTAERHGSVGTVPSAGALAG
ncbi:universal stress protein [Jidongwangia harbinensis]|uniref:universal stress protein n=1 Tax=Jidongwangia harbinensis TaxID=2878561 RepID=UPI001CD9CB0B|nr:universal stress protein [Jidongwangia harbinensis]MCA2218823.1 universal stress protein [Jidongwangia harbinensis]